MPHSPPFHVSVRPFKIPQALTRTYWRRVAVLVLVALLGALPHAPRSHAQSSQPMYYFSSSGGGKVGDILFADEDVLAYNPATDRWTMFIDGSDLGLADADIDAFEFVGISSLYLSFDAPLTLPDIPFTVDDSDIVRFMPASLGSTTSGRFEFVFDGSDVGLDTDAEDVDAIAFAEHGGQGLMLSTQGASRVPAATGEQFAADDADVLGFNHQRFGEATRGSFTRLLRGSRIGLETSSENIGALFFSQPMDAFVFGTQGLFHINDGVSGRGSDLVRCVRFDIGDDCSAFAFFEGASKGFGEVIDAFSIGD